MQVPPKKTIISEKNKNLASYGRSRYIYLYRTYNDLNQNQNNIKRTNNSTFHKKEGIPHYGGVSP